MSEPVTSVGRRSFAWLIATLIALHACMAVTRVAASLWVLDEGRGEWAVGLVLSSFAIAPIALSMWAGRLADRHGLHPPVRLAVVIALAGALLALALRQLWAIAISCLLAGGALALGAVAIQREVGRLARAPADLKRLFSWVALGPALSNTAAPVAAGLVIDHAGYVWAFALAAALPLLCLWALGQLPRQTPPQPLAGAAAPGPAWALLRQPLLRRLLIVNIVLAACWDAHSFVVPVVGHGRGLSASAIGLVLGAFATAATLVRLLIARYGARLDERRSLQAAIGLAAATLAAYAWLPGTGGLMLGSALLGLALGSVQPMVLAMLHQVVPERAQGQALGLRMFATNAATVAMPLGFGLLAGATAAVAPLWLMAAALLGALQVSRGLHRGA